MEDKIYLCIDLKTFYASVECVERGLDPFTTKLVVADPERCEKTICLAISPAMKALGIHNRCRVFEIPKDVSYIMAKPRMKKYIEYSADIYSIYLKYIAKEDIYVYSIDECFLDITNYLDMYQKSPKELAKIIIDDVYHTTGICATAGIGTNLFLTKVAMDVTAKHVDDHMGYLDEESFQREIWHHRPITDIWQIGSGIAKRLEKYGIYDLYGVAHADYKTLEREFGVTAEYLYDHAWGREPITIPEIHAYVPESQSLSTAQILPCGYDKEDCRLVLKELVDSLTLDLIEQGLVISSIGLMITYRDLKDVDSISLRLEEYVNSYKILSKEFGKLFDKIYQDGYDTRSIGITFAGIRDEGYRTLDLFSDEDDLNREVNLSKTIVDIKKKYGKNSILKAMDIGDKAMAQERNHMIGGHNSE